MKKGKNVKKLELSPKRERFCQEWVIDCNSTQAAIRAEYSKVRAGQTGSRLYKDGNIRARIDELQAEIGKKLGVTQERVLNELAKLAFTDLADVVKIDENGVIIKNSSELSKQQLGAIAEITESKTVGKKGEEYITRKIKMHDKKGALDSLARHLGMFNDKIQHTGAGGGPIETQFTVEFVTKKEE